MEQELSLKLSALYSERLSPPYGSQPCGDVRHTVIKSSFTNSCVNGRRIGRYARGPFIFRGRRIPSMMMH